MNVLITGWSGTGKSTICQELLRLGYAAFDTDEIEGLCSWVDVQTGVKYGSKCPEKFSTLKYGWDWDGKVLEQTLVTNDLTFYCGNASNAFTFYDHFDKIFVLDLPETEQRRRMMARTEHNFGQDPDTQDIVVQRQKELVPKAVELGAIKLDALPTATETITTILKELNI